MGIYIDAERVVKLPFSYLVRSGPRLIGRRSVWFWREVYFIWLECNE